MKVILVLLVTFVKYVQLSTAGEELPFQETLDTHSECQGEDCLTLDTSMNRRSLEDIDEGFNTEKLPSRQLHQIRLSLQRKYQKVANKKIINIFKLLKSHLKNLKIHTNNGSKYISRLLKRSPGGELDDLDCAKNITLSSCVEIMLFVNSTVEKLRTFVESTGKDIKEIAALCYNNSNKIQLLYQHRFFRKLQPDPSEMLIELNYVKDSYVPILMDMYRTADYAITALAAGSGSKVMEMSRNNCDKYHNIFKYYKVQEYVNFACKRMAKITQLSSDKFDEIAKACLKFLLHLTEYSTKVLKIIAVKFYEYATIGLIDHEKGVAVKATVPELFLPNNATFDAMVNKLNNLVSDLFDSVNCKGFESWEMGKASTCPATSC